MSIVHCVGKKSRYLLPMKKPALLMAEIGYAKNASTHSSFRDFEAAQVRLTECRISPPLII
jgi:hypothetical protein